MELPTQNAAEKRKTLNVRTRVPLLVGYIGFLVLFAGVGGWLYYSNIGGAVIAPGAVAVQGKPKLIQHLDGGIVSQINVSDGARVERDQVLITLDKTLLEANIEIYKTRLQESVAQQSRLIAERDELSDIIWNDRILEIFKIAKSETVRNGQRRLFESRKATRAGQVEQLGQKVAQFENQITGVTALITSKKNRINLLEDELGGLRQLLIKGLVGKAQVISLERQKEDLLGQMAEHTSELASIENSINEARIQILQVDREFQTSVLTELRELDQSINDITQQLFATNEQFKRIEIKAPVSGIIHELSVFTIGGVIAPGGPILQIIPQDEVLEVESNVEPQFVDELHPGQLATLRFSAFNQRTTPEIEGEISSISPSTVLNEQTGLSYYKIRISVAPDQLARLGDQPLIPGMPVEAFIKTRDRTALNYLTKPLMDQINRAFREE